VPSKRLSRSPRNYLARREQRRLFMLVMTLGLVAVLMNEASKPDRWYWIWGGNPPTNDSILRGTEQPVDTRLAEARISTEPGTFVAARPAVARQLPDKSYFGGVRPELLADIRDDAVFVSGDHAGFFHLLNILRQADPAQIAAASTGEVSFVQIFKQPAEYRGQLVTLRGTLRRATWRDAPQNDDGIEGYFHTVLQPRERPENPVVIYCLELPDGFPTGEEIRVDHVTVTGFFFKRWAYRAGDGIRTAPLLLARGITWQPMAADSQPPFTQTRQAALLVGGCAAVGLAGAVLLVILGVRRSKRRVVSTAAIKDFPPAAVGAALAGIATAGRPQEVLRALEERAE